ncbi:elongation factor G [Smaragdicoccus niigatensis]|uniref:elongation factor G n=1 Tax=Smaragdicoccus niigatensis TaxID=359359 RepID=UPI00036B0DEC|nr:elongation factor G [Smaragdicoccus niigatensis]
MGASSIRNVALVGHQGTGKTTLAEAMLYASGVISRPGRVELGNTSLDNSPEEIERHQSLALGVATFAWQDCQINLIDTPGYADFAGDCLTALQVADVAVFVIDGVAGLQPGDELMWEAASNQNIPRLIFINKMDKDRADFSAVVEEIREQFGQGVELVELPVTEGSAFRGVADLVTEHVFLYTGNKATESDELPADIADQEHSEHDHLVEDVVEVSDDLIEKYLDGETITPEELEGALRTGFGRATVWPVLCGSATECTAVDRLLEFICHVAPAPTEEPEGEAAYVFKTQTDDFVGQLALIKVVAGSIKVDDVLVNHRTGTRERLHHLLRVVGTKTTPVDHADAGDIVATIKLSDVATGDFLVLNGTPVGEPQIEYRQPVYGLGISTPAAKDQDKLSTALSELVRDDPSLQVVRDESTHQTVLRGAGDVHVQVALARLKRRYGIAIDTEPVKVAYLETLARGAEAEGRHKKQSGGHGQFGVALVRFEPLHRDGGFEFADETKGGVIPKSLVPAVGKGISEAMQRGGKHGYPLVDIKATVLDGKYHSVDSDEHSFRMAGAIALKDAIDRAGTKVLEPVHHIEVTVPASLQGDVMADIGRRRGQIEGTEPISTAEVTIVASVPQGEMSDYAIALRSMTHGRGRFTTQFARYQELP